MYGFASPSGDEDNPTKVGLKGS